MAPQHSPEYLRYKSLAHWQPTQKIPLPSDIVSPEDPLFPLFAYLYSRIRDDYKEFPLRKNREKPFLHPLNLVLDLKKAEIDDVVTLCIGLAHDVIEEKVDLFKKKYKIQEDAAGIKRLDAYELAFFRYLEAELRKFCQEKNYALSLVKEIIETLKLLTRHKRDFYYCSVSAIFNCPHKSIKERAIQVKLADRIHNVQSLSSFDEEGRIYQCFKNLFILNNAKKYLQEKFGKVDPNRGIYPTEKLFKKCAKATFDGFLLVHNLCLKKGASQVEGMLMLAFKKFALEKEGHWAVTHINEKETHPMRLFQGIVEKYSARLHHDWKEFARLKEKEKEYCHKFFLDYQFNEKQLQALIDFKDAYALKEIVTYLLYQRDYFLSGFTSRDINIKKKVYLM